MVFVKLTAADGEEDAQCSEAIAAGGGGGDGGCEACSLGETKGEVLWTVVMGTENQASAAQTYAHVDAGAFLLSHGVPVSAMRGHFT